MDIYTHVYCNVTVTRPAMFDPSALLDIKHRETSFSAGGKYVWFSFIRGFSASKATGEPSTRMLWSQREKLLAALPGRDWKRKIYRGMNAVVAGWCIGRLAMQWFEFELDNGPLLVAVARLCADSQESARAGQVLWFVWCMIVLWNSRHAREFNCITLRSDHVLTYFGIIHSTCWR